jgi:hypothetical protein
MATFHGLIIYEVSDNGNLLTGRYINTPKDSRAQPPYDIDSEIARKQVPDNIGVEGIYDSRYIQTTPDPRIVTPCILVVTKHNEVYEFVWSDENGPFFKGIGMEVDDRHIAVSYSNP